jgi:hypothetical protein
MAKVMIHVGFWDLGHVDEMGAQPPAIGMDLRSPFLSVDRAMESLDVPAKGLLGWWARTMDAEHRVARTALQMMERAPKMLSDAARHVDEPSPSSFPVHPQHGLAGFVVIRAGPAHFVETEAEGHQADCHRVTRVAK